MELFLEYYYGIHPVNMEYFKNQIKVKTKESSYFLYEVEKEDFLYYGFVEKNKKYHQILLNQFQNRISPYQGKHYVLCFLSKEEVSIFPPQCIFQKEKCFWRKHWIEQSRKQQEFYQTIYGKYPLIEESIDYYFGLWEMGIYLLKSHEREEQDLYISHQNYSQERFWNPLEIRIDIKERDLGEYLKYLFWTHQEEKVENLLKECSHYQFDFVIARLCYPNFYWKAIDEYLENGKIEPLQNIINRTTEYEKYIQKIQKWTNQKTSLWLEMF